MKKFLIFLFLGISTMSYSQKSSENIEWIPFNWTSGSIQGKYIDKLTMLIPVTIDELPYKFVMQFDLGAVTTVFYENPLKPFLEKYPSLNSKSDMTKKFEHAGQEYPMFRNVNLRLGKVVFKDIYVGLLTNYWEELSLDSINSETEIRIGTIGADLAQNKVLIIDYKLNRLAVTDTLPSEYRNISFEKFKIDHGRIKLPFRINEKVEDLMFDTGSSMFSLITSKQNAQAIGGTEIVDSLTVMSWSSYITFYGLEVVAPIMFGSKNMERSIVYYNENTDWEYFYKYEKIWGLTGNAYFFNNVVVIDYKNNRFGVQ